MNMFRQMFVAKDLLSFLHTGLRETIISNDQFERGGKKLDFRLLCAGHLQTAAVTSTLKKLYKIKTF